MLWGTTAGAGATAMAVASLAPCPCSSLPTEIATWSIHQANLTWRLWLQHNSLSGLNVAVHWPSIVAEAANYLPRVICSFFLRILPQFLTEYRTGVCVCVCVCVCVLVIQSCPTLCDPMDCSLPVSSGMEFSRQNTRVGYHSLLQGVFPTQGSNPVHLHCKQNLYCLSHQGNYRAHNHLK